MENETETETEVEVELEVTDRCIGDERGRKVGVKRGVENEAEEK